jgi:hypothetical protein
MSWRSPDAKSYGVNPSEIGWLGVEILQDAVDWPLCAELGDGTVRVRVLGNPAKKAGLQNGDYVISVNGISLQTFLGSHPAVGATAILKVCRETPHGQLVQQSIEVTLVRPPRPGSQRPTTLTVPCGARVQRKERFRWLAQVSGPSPMLRPLDKAIATRLLTYYCDRSAGDDCGNAYPSHATLAAEQNVSVRALQRSLAALHDSGLLEIRSGKKQGRSNVYWPCWPNAEGKLVQLKDLC